MALAQAQKLDIKNEYEAFGVIEAYSKSSEKNAEKMFESIKTGVGTGKAGYEYFLGRMYSEGIGVRADEKLAMYWFQRGAELGIADSQLRLGSSLHATDSRAAVFWLTTAANQGWDRAQFVLGFIYFNGAGIPKDERQGYFWFLLAATSGGNQAKQARDHAGEQLSPEQRTVVQTAASNWRRKPATLVKYYPATDSSTDRHSTSQQSNTTGSGFRVARGFVVTNHHVIEGCSRLRVNGVEAQVRAIDARSDLALLNTNLAGFNASLRSQRASVGEPVAVAGYPLRGLLSGFNLTTGNLSSLSGIGGDTSLLQITAPVQPGNSGGPVLDSSGNLIGVVVSKLDGVKAIKITGDIPQNVNFAINANTLRSFLDSNTIVYDMASSEKILLTTTIAEKAKGFTVLVECWK